jgi:hypothetical protein
MGHAQWRWSRSSVGRKSELRQFFAGARSRIAGSRCSTNPGLQDVARRGDGAGADEFTTRRNYLWLSLKAPFTNADSRIWGASIGLFALNLFGGKGIWPLRHESVSGHTAGLKSLAELANLGWLGVL